MRRCLLPAALTGACLATAGVIPPAAATAPPYTVTTLHFRVVVGPDDHQVCDVVGDVYRPVDATASHPDPAILTTNGFGGSKDDQAYIGQAGAQRGYVVLSYSGLGFGGSGCKIELDDPDWDGKAASQLISYLGGEPGIAFTDAAHQHAAPTVDYVIQDGVAHDGRAHAYDPRVGMVGGSYGGEVQFAAAAVDPRLDTIVPVITWNDLAYSLAPNNTDIAGGVTSSTPGVVKVDWPSLFFADGVADGAQGAQSDPSRNVGCPNFDDRICPAFVESGALGYPTPSTLSLLDHASVDTYIANIRIPTLLMQGEKDSLFNLQETVATYQSLRAQHVPVSMIWQSWGHSDLTPAPGEFSQDASVFDTYEGQRVLAWFDHYLKGAQVSTGPGFAYYRDWIPAPAQGPDTAQYATAPSYPSSGSARLYLSGGNGLVPTRSAVLPGSAAYANPPGGVPASYSETSAIQSSLPGNLPPPSDTRGTYAGYTSAPLASNLDVAGIPAVTLHLSAPTAAAASGAGPAAMVEMFAKLYDVAPDGSVTLVNRLVSACRVGDPTRPVQVQLPGIVHRFDAGHRLELVIAATDAAFKNSAVVTPVTVLTSPGDPGLLTLPTVP